MTPDTSANQTSAITYPQAFPIKVMGARHDDFARAVAETARRFDPGLDAETLEIRESSKGNYLSVTVTVWATSRQQLDDLYRALTSHPLVKVVL